MRPAGTGGQSLPSMEARRKLQCRRKGQDLQSGHGGHGRTTVLVRFAWIEGEHAGCEEVKLASDAFGNFVVQKLLEHGTAEQLEARCGRASGQPAGANPGQPGPDLTRSCSRRSRAMRLGGSHGFRSFDVVQPSFRALVSRADSKI